jgi:hypothetical protein
MTLIEALYLVEYDAVWFIESHPTFRRNMSLPSSCSSETLVDSQRTTRRHIPEDRTLRNHRCENLES